jgi:hypothetical protein
MLSQRCSEIRLRLESGGIIPKEQEVEKKCSSEEVSRSEAVMEKSQFETDQLEAEIPTNSEQELLHESKVFGDGLEMDNEGLFDENLDEEVCFGKFVQEYTVDQDCGGIVTLTCNTDQGRICETVPLNKLKHS